MEKNRLWIRGPIWDLFFVFSGLWILAIFAFADWTLGAAASVAFVVVAIGNLVFWAGHNLSPVFVAWSEVQLRAEMKRNLVLFMGLPLVLVILAILFEVLSVAPFENLKWVTSWGELRPSAVFFCVYVFWNAWHFGSQHFGILTLYRRRLAPGDRSTRGEDAAYCRILFCIVMPVMWFSHGIFMGPFLHFLPDPNRYSHLRIAAVVFIFALTALMVVRELMRRPASPHRLFYFVLIAAQPLLAACTQPVFHFAVYTTTHYMLVVALTAQIFSHDQKNIFGLPKRIRLPGFQPQSVAAHFVSLLIWSPLFYIVMFGHQPRPFMQPTHWHLAGDLQIFWPRAISPVLKAISVGLYYGLAFVHFFYDRFVYQFQRHSQISDALTAPPVADLAGSCAPSLGTVLL